MIVNLYAADGKPRWMVRIYDALTGTLKATALDRVATYLSDVDGDGSAELLADIATDPTLTDIQGACLIKVSGNQCEVLWEQQGSRSAPALALKRTDAARDFAQALFVQSKSET